MYVTVIAMVEMLPHISIKAVANLLALALLTHGLQGGDLRLSGEISMQKLRFRRGEPITSSLLIKNTGEKSVSIVSGSLYGTCGGSYNLTVNGKKAIPTWLSSVRSKARNHIADIAASCSSGGRDLAPGQTYSETFVLNKEYDLFRHPGEYRIVVEKRVSYDVGGAIPHNGSPVTHFVAQFKLDIE